MNKSFSTQTQSELQFTGTDALAMKSNLTAGPLTSLALLILIHPLAAAGAFEGRISATLTRGGEAQTLLFTVGTNQMRIERAENDRPYARNVINLDTGDRIILYPHNRSFVRLKSHGENATAMPPGFHAMPPMPSGAGPAMPIPSAPPPPARVGPRNLPGMSVPPSMPQLPSPPAGAPPGVGPNSGAGFSTVPSVMAGMPTMPVLPPMMMEKAVLTATGHTTNLLGYACQEFELKQRGEVMEIWATDKLLAFQPYLQNQPPRFGPHMLEEQWVETLKARKLFPLLAVLRFETPAATGQTAPPPGPERLRFEVTSVTPETIKDKDGALFEPPPDYHQLDPLPF